MDPASSFSIYYSIPILGLDLYFENWSSQILLMDMHSCTWSTSSHFACKWWNRLSSISISSCLTFASDMKLTTFSLYPSSEQNFPAAPRVHLKLNWPSTNNKLYDTGMWEHFLWTLWAMLREHRADQMGLLSTSWMAHSLSRVMWLMML